MARTHKSDSSSGNFAIGNGSTVLTPAFPLLDFNKFTRISDFTITPSNVKIDPDMKMIIERDSERLRYKTLKYNSGQIEDWQLSTILKSPEGAKDNAKAKLTRDGKSAVISEVSKKLNDSSIDHSSRFLLSHVPLYVYALSYAIYYEKVKDAEGIDDRIVTTTENKIKTYFNRAFAKKMIRDRHLKLSREQKKSILSEASRTPMSYLKGEPLKVISKIIAKYVDHGKLNTLVDMFFESGEVDPAKGTPQVRQLMVKYLVDIGLNVSFDEEEPEVDIEANPEGLPREIVPEKVSTEARTEKNL